MERIINIFILAAALLLGACTNDMPQDTPDGAHGRELLISASMLTDGSRANGSTGYSDTQFALNDEIGIFVVKDRPDIAQNPITVLDIYKNYFNVGYYKKNALETDFWTSVTSPGNQPVLYAPQTDSSPLNIYAYYPWASYTEQQVITNMYNSQAIKFKISQEQTGAKKNLCNIMRAIPITGRVFDGTAEKYKIKFQFEHILSLVETRIKVDHDDPTWNQFDTMKLHKIVVLGKKISTEGSFDITGEDPNVRISSNSTSALTSVYMADPEVGTLVPDAYTGATTGATHRDHLVRSVIIPPIPEGTSNDNVEVGQMADMEILLALQWKKAGETFYRNTNRRYIIKGVTIESGKRYVFNITLRKDDVPQQIITVNAVSSNNWTDNFDWSTTFE